MESLQQLITQCLQHQLSVLGAGVKPLQSAEGQASQEGGATASSGNQQNPFCCRAAL